MHVSLSMGTYRMQIADRNTVFQVLVSVFLLSLPLRTSAVVGISCSLKF